MTAPATAGSGKVNALKPASDRTALTACRSWETCAALAVVPGTSGSSWNKIVVVTSAAPAGDTPAAFTARTRYANAVPGDTVPSAKLGLLAVPTSDNAPPADRRSI